MAKLCLAPPTATFATASSSVAVSTSKLAQKAGGGGGGGGGGCVWLLFVAGQCPRGRINGACALEVALASRTHGVSSRLRELSPGVWALLPPVSPTDAGLSPEPVTAAETVASAVRHASESNVAATAPIPAELPSPVAAEAGGESCGDAVAAEFFAEASRLGGLRRPPQRLLSVCGSAGVASPAQLQAWLHGGSEGSAPLAEVVGLSLSADQSWGLELEQLCPGGNQPRLPYHLLFWGYLRDSPFISYTLNRLVA